MSSNDTKADNLLKAMEKYLDSLEMGIFAPNCAALSIITTRDSWHLADSKLKSKNEDSIPVALADTTLQYVGGKISSWTELTIDSLEGFRTMLQRVLQLVLKPHQEVELITAYIILRFIYHY
jgi:hypothetical protein